MAPNCIFGNSIHGERNALLQLYSFGVTGNEHIHKAKRQTPHESMLPSWCDSQERLIDRKRIDTSKTVSQIVIACQTIKEPVLTGVINVWPVI